jgi:uroporphyrinogen-III synthase
MPLLNSSEKKYSHIAFTSKNGISAVVQRLAHLSGGEAAVDKTVMDRLISRGQA